MGSHRPPDTSSHQKPRLLTSVPGSGQIGLSKIFKADVFKGRRGTSLVAYQVRNFQPFESQG